nr:plasminogen activator inhibitor 1 RNA-binding protein-like [Leptinotarsa decemlineata]
MENLYGIGVANRYALFLDDESDPLETLSLKELEKDSKKKNKVAEKENKVKSEPLSKGKTAPAPKKIIKDNNRDQENKREDVKSSQRSIVDNKQDRENYLYTESSHGYRGVKPIDKREGVGAHNWGSHKDDIEEADRPNNDINQNWGDDSKVEAVDEKKEEVDVETTPIEEEPKELTLDEWKAQRAGRVKPQYNIRKAGEGEDPSQWKKMFELRKKEKEEVS